ncbi:uncharacterized protein LOC117785035 [Drosophila innubila]|uniref:uncharacterized protein LOC117785035 n=1 Tax=Drosophila innubila TaxID=198719 RepID=UPI00148B424B|nr:uncharacterized protein LOC117785035 [Drosophila innubila]
MDINPLALSVYIVHITSCTLIIISVFKNYKFLVFSYLITVNIRLIYSSLTFLWHNIMDSFHSPHCILGYLIFAFSFYFWFCAYSWYKALETSSRIEPSAATATSP